MDDNTHQHDNKKKTYAQKEASEYELVLARMLLSGGCVKLFSLYSLRYMYLFVLRFYGPVNPMGSNYLTTRLLGRLSPLSG